MNLLRGVMSGTLDFVLKGPLIARILFPSGLDPDPFEFAINNRGIFGIFFYVLYSTLLHLPPLRSTVSTDAAIEPRTVATSALAVRRSNH